MHLAVAMRSCPRSGVRVPVLQEPQVLEIVFARVICTLRCWPGRERPGASQPAAWPARPHWKATRCRPARLRYPCGRRCWSAESDPDLIRATRGRGRDLQVAVLEVGVREAVAERKQGCDGLAPVPPVTDLQAFGVVDLPYLLPPGRTGCRAVGEGAGYCSGEPAVGVSASETGKVIGNLPDGLTSPNSRSAGPAPSARRRTRSAGPPGRTRATASRQRSRSAGPRPYWGSPRPLPR